MSSFINKRNSNSSRTRRKSPKPSKEISTSDEPRFKRKKVSFQVPQEREGPKEVEIPTTILKDIVEHDTNEIIDEGEIESITFSFMSSEEIKQYSVVQVTETKLNGPNSLYDPRMGAINKNDICETCEGDWDECPGHFGHIELYAKIPHPLRIKNILEYLKCFCKQCHRLVVKKEKIELLNIHKLNGEQRFKKILDEAENKTSVCPHCEFVLPDYTCFDDKYTFEVKNKKFHLTYEDIATIFSNIRNEEVDLLGFDSSIVHPSRLIISSLLVAPPCVRPFVTTPDGISCEDDLTYKYIDVLKMNKKVGEAPNENSRQNEIDKLYFHIRTLFDNNKGKARDIGGKRPIKCIKKRLSGKTGRIRQNILGKRVDYCARTVIGGDATCLVDELIVPQEIAKDLSYPVSVTQLNINQCQDYLDKGKVNYIIRNGKTINAKIATGCKEFKIFSGDIVKKKNSVEIDLEKYKLIKGKDYVFEKGDVVFRYEKSVNDKGQIINKRKEIRDIPINKKRKYELKVGDKIERQLQNGDMCVFNRQPTLWKGSMRAKTVRILPGKTFRFSLASTQAFNADFDGDGKI